MNLALPGLGQVVSGRWISGGIFMMLSLFFFGLGVWYALSPLFAMIETLLNEPESAIEYKIETVKVFICFGLLVLVWIISLADGFRKIKLHKEDTDNE